MKLFYWSVGGLLGLGGLIWAIAKMPPVYIHEYGVSADITAPNEWEKSCFSFTMVRLAGRNLHYSESREPMSECDRRDAPSMGIVHQYELECPGGSCEAPGGPTDGRIMEFMWKEQQKTAPR